jgi:hypothetical protein
MPKIVTLVSNDFKTEFGTAVVEAADFPGEPQTVTWRGRVFASVVDETGTGPSFYCEQSTIAVPDDGVTPPASPATAKTQQAISAAAPATPR